jgi:pyruvate, water dikinase
VRAYTSGFGEPACRDPDRYGGKAAGLAELASAGLPVPAGFAVSAEAYHEFLDASGLRSVVDLALASAPDESAARHIAPAVAAAAVPAAVAEEIRERYRLLCRETGVADVAVAVRSSATAEDSAAASFAGGFDTWVDVSGADAVLAHVHSCWASVFSARAIGYARASGVDPADVAMAVVVQRTVRADAAGVMFTISPVTGDRSRIVLEASWGLGLAVVGGEVTPDRWVVDKVAMTVAGFTPGDKRIEYRHGDVAVAVDRSRWAQPCLTDDQVVALARLGKEIERGQGRAQDIEFAVEGGELVLLQRRPETVWSARPHVPRFAAGHGLTSWISGAIVPGAVA